MLGMGGEGHINSLFPDTAAVRESVRYVVGVTNSPNPPPRRITLTLEALRRSREMWLVVTGTAKADAVAAALAGAQAVNIPAADAIGTEKTVRVLDVEAAASCPVDVKLGVKMADAGPASKGAPDPVAPGRHNSGSGPWRRRR